MKTEVLRQIGLDSGALTLLGTVVHRMDYIGRYRGSVVANGVDVGGFDVIIQEEGPTQVNIDLATADKFDARRDCYGEAGPKVLSAGGYLVLHVTSGMASYFAVVTPVSTEEEGNGAAFDSRQLSQADLFSAVVLRPGEYRVTNAESGATAVLRVTLPDGDKAAYRSREPVRVLAGDVFTPSEIAVESTQGQVYAFEGPGRIVIDLVDPYDPQKGERSPRYRRVKTATTRITSSESQEQRPDS